MQLPSLITLISVLFYTATTTTALPAPYCGEDEALSQSLSSRSVPSSSSSSSFTESSPSSSSIPDNSNNSNLPFPPGGCPTPGAQLCMFFYPQGHTRVGCTQDKKYTSLGACALGQQCKMQGGKATCVPL